MISNMSKYFSVDDKIAKARGRVERSRGVHIIGGEVASSTYSQNIVWPLRERLHFVYLALMHL